MCDNQVGANRDSAWFYFTSNFKALASPRMYLLILMSAECGSESGHQCQVRVI